MKFNYDNLSKLILLRNIYIFQFNILNKHLLFQKKKEKFIVNQMSGTNERLIKSKTIPTATKPVSNENIMEINSRELSSIMNGSSHLNKMV